VRQVHLTGTVEAAGELVLTVNPRVAGPRLGQEVQKVIRAAKEHRWTRDGDDVSVDGVALLPGEFELRLLPQDQSTSRALAGEDAIVVLDVAVTPELEAEGVARDVVRLVQEARRSAGLNVRDRIALVLSVPATARGAVERHHALIAAEVLATSLEIASLEITSLEITSLEITDEAGPDAVAAELAGHGPVQVTLRRRAG